VAGGKERSVETAGRGEERSQEEGRRSRDHQAMVREAGEMGMRKT
jgi:hypothetical protein